MKGVTILKNKKYPFIPDLYLKDNPFNNNRLYKGQNVFSQEIQEAPAPIEQPPAPEQDLPPGDVPAAPAEPGTIPEEVPEEVGYISVGVFTASGALPVEDAVVTVYVRDESGVEEVLSHLVTDANGQVPIIELPVIYDRLNPFESYEYYFATYNLRVQAINYYTFNIQDVRIFPETTTNYMVELIPVAAGSGGIGPNLNFEIPPSQIDLSND